jgi:hypothetical protein
MPIIEVVIEVRAPIDRVFDLSRSIDLHTVTTAQNQGEGDRWSHNRPHRGSARSDLARPAFRCSTRANQQYHCVSAPIAFSRFDG